MLNFSENPIFLLFFSFEIYEQDFDIKVLLDLWSTRTITMVLHIIFLQGWNFEKHERIQ